MRRSFRRITSMTLVWAGVSGVTAIVAAAPGAQSGGGAITKRRQPNVIIVFPDQLRWSEVGCYGNPVIRTPNMDRLASEGVRFEQAFTNFPVCSPARSILLSGRYARSTGVLHNQDTEAQPDRVTNRSETLAEAFAGAGYQTALIGKWHLSPSPKLLGFQETLRPQMRHRYYNQSYFRNEKEIYIHEGYGPDHETDEAVAFIRRKREKPYFLFLSYGPPHMPLDEIPDKYRSMYKPDRVPLRENVWQGDQPAYDEHWFSIYMWDFQYYNHPSTFSGHLPEGMDLKSLTALYYGQVTAVDDCIGRVLQTLKEAHQEQDTIILLTSDHGDMLGSHQAFNKNRHYDESIRVPMVIRYPRGLKPRIIDQQIMSLVDVTPTLLDICGIRIPESVQGTSLKAVLEERKPEVGENVAYIETTGNDGVRTPRYTYLEDRDSGRRLELFDNREDPFQMKSVLNEPEYQGTVRELRQKLSDWRSRTPWAGKQAETASQ